MKIPFSSNIEDEINGYVETKPDVNTFLFATFFISLSFCISGIVVKNPCSSLK